MLNMTDCQTKNNLNPLKSISIDTFKFLNLIKVFLISNIKAKDSIKTTKVKII